MIIKIITRGAKIAGIFILTASTTGNGGGTGRTNVAAVNIVARVTLITGIGRGAVTAKAVDAIEFAGAVWLEGEAGVAIFTRGQAATDLTTGSIRITSATLPIVIKVIALASVTSLAAGAASAISKPPVIDAGKTNTLLVVVTRGAAGGITVTRVAAFVAAFAVSVSANKFAGVV